MAHDPWATVHARWLIGHGALTTVHVAGHATWVTVHDGVVHSSEPNIGSIGHKADRADRAAGRSACRAAGERTGLVDFNNYKTSNRLQDFQKTTRVPGLSLYTKPQQEDVLKQKCPKATFSKDKPSIRLQQFQQTTRLPTDDNSFN